MNANSIEEVNTILSEYHKDSEAIYQELGELMFYMRNVDWNTALNSTPKMRKMFVKVIKGNVERRK